MDIECSDNLPPSEDPWSEPFYRDLFTPAEIGWCLRQPDRQLAFCALWSAKEAAIKCRPELAGLRPVEIEVLHDGQRRLTLRTTRDSQPDLAGDYLLSIGCSGRISLAVCVQQPPRPAPAARKPPE